LSWHETFFLSLILIKFSENDYIIYSFRALPSAKDEQVGTDGCRSMTISLSWWVSDVFATLPAHFFGTPYLEILTLLLLQDVPITISGVLGPATEHDDVTARNIQSVSISSFWGKSRNSQSWPNKGVCIKNPNIIHITTLNISTLIEPTGFEFCFSELETTVDNEVVSDQDASVSLSGSRCRTTAIWSLPGHDFKV